MSGLIILHTSSSPTFSAKISPRHEATQGSYGKVEGQSSPLHGWLVEGESQVKCPHACARQTGGTTPMP